MEKPYEPHMRLWEGDVRRMFPDPTPVIANEHARERIGKALRTVAASILTDPDFDDDHALEIIGQIENLAAIAGVIVTEGR